MLLVKVPAINGLGHTDGCEKAPDKILENLKNIYTNEARHELDYLIEEVKVDNENAEEAQAKIYGKGKELLNSNERVIFLGGDHSISYPLAKAFSESFENSCLIILDAHADSMHDFTPPTHEDWLRKLIEDGFKPENVILVGARNIHKIEAEFLKQKHMNCFDMKELSSNFNESLDEITAMARNFGKVYLSIDIDIADSVFVPGTGYPEPAGLTSRELITIIQRFNTLKNLKAIDLVEVNPEKDINNATSKLAAKIVGELC